MSSALSAATVGRRPGERYLDEPPVRRRRVVYPRVVNVAAPAAAADWFVDVPGGVIWHPQAVTATLTTSATVGNRLPSLTYSDRSSTYMTVPGFVAVAASNVRTFTWTLNLGSIVAPANFAAGGSPLPTIPVIGGHRIAVSSTLLASDQWSAIVVYVYQVDYDASVGLAIYPGAAGDDPLAAGGEPLGELG